MALHSEGSYEDVLALLTDGLAWAADTEPVKLPSYRPNLTVLGLGQHMVRKVDTAGLITTIAETGTAGFNGDNIAPTSAELNSPGGVAVDVTGNVFIADINDNMVRKVDAAGLITTIAGTGTAGFNGDNIAATSAQLNSPSGIAVDSLGNVYIADHNNQRVRRVDTAGLITTVVGTGTSGFSGDGGPAVSAQLFSPTGLAIDTVCNVYVVDEGNQRIRKISSGGVVTSIAGNGLVGYNGDGISATTAELDSPFGVAVDSAGSVYIADANNHRVRKVATSGLITTVAGTGNQAFNGDNIDAALANLNFPFGVAFDAIGNIFIAEIGNHRVRKIV